MTRFVFVTGGVVSSLGKGIASASLGAGPSAGGIPLAILSRRRSCGAVCCMAPAQFC